MLSLNYSYMYIQHFFLKKIGSRTHKVIQNLVGEGGLVIPMPGKKVPERCSRLCPSEKKLPKRRCSTKLTVYIMPYFYHSVLSYQRLQNVVVQSSFYITHSQVGDYGEMLFLKRKEKIRVHTFSECVLCDFHTSLSIMFTYCTQIYYCSCELTVAMLITLTIGQ
jgi:hypothetical protein